MRKTIIVFVLLLGFVGWSQNGYIQIIAEPDIVVYLDDVNQGVTSKSVGGLIIEDVKPGSHNLRLELKGYVSKSERINISPGQVFEYRVESFTPDFKVSQMGEKETNKISRATGNLLIQSIPIGINVSISELGINSSKDRDQWLVESLPVGTYNISFRWNSKTINQKVKIEKGIEKHYFINMMNGDFENKTNPDAIGGLIKKRVFDDEGRLVEEYSVDENGLKQGKFVKYFSGGNLRYEASYKDDEYHGEFKSYWPGGKMKNLTNYVNGKRHGEYKYWRENGSLSQEGNYLNGKEDGCHKSYNGNLVYEIRCYKEGEMTEKRQFYNNGAKKMYMTYKNGSTTYHKRWDKNGKVTLDKTTDW